MRVRIEQAHGEGSVEIPDDLAGKIESYSKETDIPVEFLVRAALWYFFEKGAAGRNRVALEAGWRIRKEVHGPHA